LTTAIWWIRRDLRLSDNQALHAAHQQADQVVPLFILDPVLQKSDWYSEKRMAFLLGGLRALDASLRAHGSRLLVRQGDPQAVLAALWTECQATQLHAEADHSPYAKKRDSAVGALLPLTLHPGVAIHPVGQIRQASSKPYTVFTPFSRKWKAEVTLSSQQLLAAPGQIQTPAMLPSLPLPTEPSLSPGVPFLPGEAEAQRRLAAFVHGSTAPIYRYGETRDRPDLAGTAQLSPYLRFGMLSPRVAAIAALQAMQSASTAEARESAERWLNELLWRDFYINILHEFPQVRSRPFRPEYAEIVWANQQADFQAWCAGETGYPIVDAAMRQLTSTGWMHNRLRMIVASFLVKDLLIDWRWGERWFMQQLVDGDPAANNGGWQWVAGVGTDAAPYFRVFNPVAQGSKFDPQGHFVRHWLPALARLPDQFVHAPWTMSPSEQLRTDCRIGIDYPAPVVDHAWARQRVLAAYKVPK
jgi:deoxyribodipyrimidine photo-lyase